MRRLRAADPFDDLFSIPPAPDTTKPWGRTVLEALDIIEAKLCAKGFPATSPWWRQTLERFYSSKRRQLVIRAGRRGGKSSTLSRVAVAEALAGEHVVPPGDTGIIGIVSIDRTEARKRIKTIREILDALDVDYMPRGDTLEITGRRITFAVFTASIGGVVGATWIFGLCDEVARWKDRDTGANPADEVLASVRPTMATMPNARLFLSSSPLGTLDAHARAFEAGDTTHQQVAYAPSWVANPTLSEEQTKADEPNERIWRREYLAVPQGTLTSVFSIDDIMRAMAFAAKPDAAASPVLIMDASRGGDAWTWIVARWCWALGRARLRVEEIGTVPDATDTNASADWIVAKAKRVGAGCVVGDQYEAGAMQALFATKGLSFFENVWTVSTKREAVDRLERMLRDSELLLPNDETLRRQLGEYSEKITRGGEMTYGGRGRHDDHAAVVVTLAMADMDRRLEMVERPASDKPQPGTKDYYDAIQADDEARLLRRIEQKAIDKREGFEL